MGVLAMIDEALKMTTSSYFFLSVGTWRFHENNFLKEAY